MVGQLHALQLAAAEGGHALVEVQIAKADFLQHPQLGDERLSVKELDGFFHGEVHHLGNGLAVVAVGQCLAIVAAAVTFLALGLNAFHKSHVAYNDAFAFAGWAGAVAIEREKLHGGMEAAVLLIVASAFFGKEFAYGVGNIKVCGGSAAEVDTDVFLADKDDVFGAVLHEMFHERALARTGHAGHHGHHPFGDF